MGALKRALEQDVLPLEVLALELLPHAQPQLVGGARRLVDVVGRAEAQGFDRRVRRGERRHDDADDLGVDVLGFPQHIDAAHLRHPDVGDEDVHALLLQELDRAHPVVGHHHLVAVALEHDRQQLSHRALVVDDQHARGRRGDGVRLRCRLPCRCFSCRIQFVVGLCLHFSVCRGALRLRAPIDPCSATASLAVAGRLRSPRPAEAAPPRRCQRSLRSRRWLQATACLEHVVSVSAFINASALGSS